MSVLSNFVCLTIWRRRRHDRGRFLAGSHRRRGGRQDEPPSPAAGETEEPGRANRREEYHHDRRERAEAAGPGAIGEVPQGPRGGGEGTGWQVRDNEGRRRHTRERRGVYRDRGRIERILCKCPRLCACHAKT